ncbi:MAG: hypothetical protein SGPRY_008228, partial [Prymnesium sp.]
MADPRRSERSSALAKGRAALASRLLEGRARALVLEEHELEVAGDVVCPDEICVSFDDVGGLDNLARQLQHAILLPLKRPDLFAQTRLLRPPKGILLHGPPGTGKTMLARAIAKEARFTFINLNPARLLSKWYGESNKFAEAYFTLAEKLAPSIIFIDEIDCLFASGRSGEHEATSTLRAQFLMLWDGLLSPTAQASPVVVLAATNRADSVDPAVLRRLPLSFRVRGPAPIATSTACLEFYPPFGLRSQVDLPNQRAREAVLRLVLRDEPLAAEVDLCALAAATDGYSGSDLEQLCKTAMMTPLEEYLQKEEIERLAASESCSNCDGVGTVDDNHRD